MFEKRVALAYNSISKDAVKQKISEVRMEGNEWQKLHFDTLYFSYKKLRIFSVGRVFD